MDLLGRCLALAGTAFACAVAAGVVALDLQGRMLPPADGAYGMSVWESLRDPFVATLWWPVVLAGAGIGFLGSCLLLRGVKLTRAVPLVLVVTVLATAAGTLFSMLLAPSVGLLAGHAAMLISRLPPGWRLEVPRQAT